MTSLAFRAKQSVISWMESNGIQETPLIFCGDFNSDPKDIAGTAYHCIAGSLRYSATEVDTNIINESEFTATVTNESWVDCLRNRDTEQFTNFGFTKNSFKTCLDELKIAMDETRIHLSLFSCYLLKDQKDETEFDILYEKYLETRGVEKTDDLKREIQKEISTIKDNLVEYMHPTARHLDHIFLRDMKNMLEITDCECPLKSDIARITGMKPIPNLAHNQPSDHLPISVSFKFRETPAPAS